MLTDHILIDKDKWIDRERERWAEYLKVPLGKGTPPGFPVSTVAVQRALVSIQMSNPAKLPSALDALYHEFWVNHAAINKPDVIQSILKPAIGDAEAATAVKRATEADVKKRLIE